MGNALYRFSKKVAKKILAIEEKQVVTEIVEKPVEKIVTKKVPVYVPVFQSDMLKGRTAFVTGGTSGIGFAIARQFLQSGATVVITSRSEERVNVACENLKTYSDRIFGVQMDSTDVESFKPCLEKACTLVEGINKYTGGGGILIYW